MKYCKRYLISMMLMLGGMTASAQVTDSTTVEPDGQNPHTTVWRKQQIPLVTSKIRLLTRAYGDSIVLRWIAEDFVSYRYLAQTGVNVLRVKRDTVAGTTGPIDTLAYALKPITMDQFRQKYGELDEQALAAMGAIYGDANDVVPNRDDFAGNSQSLSASQDISYGFAMMVAEWRKDLAYDMAVRLNDRKVERGAVYDYYVQPTVWENGGKLVFEPGVAEEVQNVPYVKEKYQPAMVDSLGTTNGSLAIGWWDGKHSSYEIDRRRTMDSEGKPVSDIWHRITIRPYVSMVEQPEGEDYCLFGDTVSELGMWEYRFWPYDAFGDLNGPAEHSIMLPDVEPPLPPELKVIVIERPDSIDPMAKVIAHIVWRKDSLEQDLAGYRLFYRPMRDDKGLGWQALNFDLLAPADTILSVDMTGKRTGMIYIASYDDTGNESKSLMQQIQLTDFKAPAIPDNFTANVRPIDIESDNDSVALNTEWAFIDLYWQPHPEDDDIDYFDVAFANDSTHEFLLRNEGGIRQSTYTDSVNLHANQKYIYYKVRAIDQSTNIGQWSHWIQVERPHITPPTQPHLGLSGHDETKGMHMEWIVGMDADMKEHTLYRRLGEEGEPEVIGQWSADTAKVRDYKFVIDDNPPYNAKERYYYWMTSTNASPFVSHSLAVSWKHQGPRTVDVDIHLECNYDIYDKATILGWQVDEKKMPEGDCYWAIFRKGPEDTRFKYYMSVEKDKRTYEEHTLKAGEKAEYYVRLQFDDGRHSSDSETVSIIAPNITKNE